MKSNKEPKFWDCSNPDVLVHTNKYDAIEEYLDNLLEIGMSKEEMIRFLDFNLMVAGYAPMDVKFSEQWFSPLEDVLERLDEEFGDPDGERTEPTKKMKEAEEAFMKVILSEYVPWACDEICVEEVHALTWVKENTPEWLED
jgi:hypothetical protein